LPRRWRPAGRDYKTHDGGRIIDPRYGGGKLRAEINEKEQRKDGNGMRIDIRGDIVEDELVKIYEWYKWPCTSPGGVAKALAEAQDGEEIDVYISSPGGSVFAGAEIYELLRQRSVTVHITGLAASAASVIACAGARTLISPAGAVMIHNVRTLVEGDYRDMEQAARTLKEVNRTISSAYMEKTGKTEKELLKLMDAETWMNAADSVANGFCDAVEARPEKKQARPAASMGLSLTEEQIETAQAAIEKEARDRAASKSGAEMKKARARLKLMKVQNSEFRIQNQETE